MGKLNGEKRERERGELVSSGIEVDEAVQER